MMLNSVDLPQPDGPINETNSPRATENETSSTATSEPSAVVNRLTMCSTLTKGSMPAALPARSGSPFTVASMSTTRRNLDQLGQLLLGQRRSCVLERDRIVDDRVESHDSIGIDGILGKETVADAFRHRFGNADEFRIGLERRGIAVHPIDRFAIRLHEPIELRLLRLQRLHVGDVQTHRLSLEHRCVVAARDHPD